MTRVAAINQLSESLAYHEAGHAAVAYVLAVDFKRVYLNHDGTGALEFASAIGEAPTYQRRSMAVVTAAGAWGETGFDGGNHTYSQSDWQIMRAYLQSSQGRGESQRRLNAEAGRLVASHWRIVDAIAQELLLRRELTEDQVNRCTLDARQGKRTCVRRCLIRSQPLAA